MTKRLQDFAKKDDAVIEVFSEILLTGIIVLAIAAVAAFVLSSLDGPDNVRVDIDHWVDKDTDTLYFRHSGGETVDVENLELVVNVNGSYETLTSEQIRANYDSDEWALGDVIEINTSTQFNYDITDDRVPTKLVHTASSLVIYDAYGSIGDSGAGGGSGNGGDGDGGGGEDSATAPQLSNPYPTSPNTSTVLEPATFNATSNQSSNNEFLLNGTRVAWSNGTSPSYTNITPSVGTYNLTLIAHNQTDPLLTDSISWVWTVEAGLPVPFSMWTFDEGGGSTAIDSKDGNDGELKDETTRFDVGVSGKAAIFGDLDIGLDYVEVPDDNSLDLGEEGSIEAWFWSEDSISKDEVIVQKGIGDFAYSLYSTNKNKITFEIEGTSKNVKVQSSESINEEQWYHVVGTWNSSEVCIYVNSIQSSKQNSQSISAKNSGEALIIGGSTDLSAGDFDGMIDEVSIYNYSLNQGDVQHLYDRFNPSDSYRVSASKDDAEESISNGDILLYKTYLDLSYNWYAGWHRGDQEVGVRFRNVAIPQGSTIESVKLVFTVDESEIEDTDLNIYGHDIDNSPEFSYSYYDITGRTKTNHYVQWNNVPAPSVGESLVSPDISSVVQEIVDRSGWSSGNSMTFIINGSGKRVVESYDGDSDKAPLLMVEYS